MAVSEKDSGRRERESVGERGGGGGKERTREIGRGEG